jgi:hypothetical protein
MIPLKSPAVSVIRLPVGGIELHLTGQSSGTIQSDLHEPDDGVELTAALNAVESLVLAHASAGIDVQSPEYLTGLETTVSKCFEVYST